MANKPSKPKTVKRRRRWQKILLFLLKLIRVPVLCAAALIAGLILGYVHMGGKQMADVFEIETWKHLIDLVFAAA